MIFEVLLRIALNIFDGLFGSVQLDPLSQYPLVQTTLDQVVVYLNQGLSFLSCFIDTTLYSTLIGLVVSFYVLKYTLYLISKPLADLFKVRRTIGF